MTVRELLATDFLRGAKLLSGKDSIDREFSWCTPDPSVDFGGEMWMLSDLLLIYVGRSPRDSWESFLDRVLHMDACGLIFLGKSWELIGVPDSAIRYADEHKLPLIWVPSNMSVTRFIKRVFPYLAISVEGEYYREAWLKKLCYTNDQIFDELTAANYGYNRDYSYYCLLLRLRVTPGSGLLPIEQRLGTAYEFLSGRFSQQEAKMLAFADGDTLVCFLPFQRPVDRGKAKERITAAIADLKQMNREWKWRASVGTQSDGIDTMGQSFLNATKTAQLIQRLDVHQKVSFYADWHMHMLLLRGPESDLQTFMMDTLHPLIHDKELMNTLTVYLTFGENLKVTAEKMYIHINTLKYRINKIRDILGCDLTDTTTRFRLRMAITIYRYLNGSKAA